MARSPNKIIMKLIFSYLSTWLGCCLKTPASANLFDRDVTRDSSGKIITVKIQHPSDIQHFDGNYDVLGIDKGGGEVTILADSRDQAKLEKEQYPFEVDEVATQDFAKASAAAQVNAATGISETFYCYRTVEETNAAAADIVATYPDLAEVVDIGDSWEKVNGIDGETNNPGGYDLYALKLTNSNISVQGGKPIFFASCSIHAREYTPQELCTRFAEMLVEGHGIDADKTALLDYHEIHLVLVGNPDARKEAESGNSWRKNKNNNEAACQSNPDRRGVDLNRNFPFNWAASGSVCDITYSGPSAESEPETIAILTYMRSIFPSNQRVFTGTTTPCNNACGDLDPSPPDAMGVGFDIHSSGKDFIYPWGYSSSGQECGNQADFRTFARRMAYYNDHEPRYGSVIRGTAKDTYYGDFGIAAYTVELGTAFFEDCSYFENTLLPDNLKALEYAAKVSRTPFLTPYGPDVVNLSLNQPGPFVVGQSVTLTATIDDGRSSTNGNFPVSSPQNIASATMYVDIPPWDTNATPISMTATGGSFGTSTQQGVEGTIDTGILQLSKGQHTLYVVGADTDGNEGPFSAIFFELVLGTCIDAGVNSGNDCSTNAECCASARRSLRGLQGCLGQNCKSTPCCTGYVCENKGRGVKECVEDTTVEVSPSPSISLEPSTVPSESPSVAPSISLAPSESNCRCAFPTSSPTSHPTSSPTAAPQGNLCDARGTTCEVGSESNCCAQTCSQKGRNYKCD